MSGVGDSGALPLAELTEEELAYAPESVDDEFVEQPQQPTYEERAAAAAKASIEAEARRSGWVPEDRYRGPAGTWRDAEEYLRRGKEILPIVRKELANTQTKLETISTEVATLRANRETDARTIAELRQQNSRAEQQGYDRAIAELKQQQRAAAQEGNLQQYDEIGEQITEVEEQRMASAAAPPPPAPVPAAPAPQAIAPDVQAFMDENPWFMTNATLHDAMRAAHTDLNTRAPGMSLANNLQAAKQKVMEDYPDMFGLAPKRPAQKRPGANTVISANGSGAPAPDPGGPPRTLAAVTDAGERRALQEQFKRSKVNMPELTESAFLRVYFEPGVDVLEVMREEKAMPAAKRRNA